MVAAADIERFILRFRDLGALAPGDTVAYHAAIVDELGYTWWGWWKKRGEQVPARTFYSLRGRARASGLPIFLLDTGQDQVYEALLTDIYWPGSEEVAPSPEPEATPEYYRAASQPAWFKLASLQEVDPADLLRHSNLHVPDAFTERRAELEPFHEKIIFSIDELREQDRTIWFLRTALDDDPSGEIRLPSGGPVPFLKTYVVSDAPRLLWLSDLHFGDHHRFPRRSGVAGESLLDALWHGLEDSGSLPIGGVLVTGDLTWQADKREFDATADFLEALLSRLRLESSHLIVCPGNHDLRWSEDPAEYGSVLDFAGKQPKRGYSDFFRRLFEQKPNDHLSMGRRMLLAGAFPVEVVALNSSTLDQVKGVFQGHGYLGTAQLRDAAKEMGWRERPIFDAGRPAPGPKAIRIAAMHHHYMPVTHRQQAVAGSQYSVVLDAEALAEWLAQHRVDLLLHGHMHQPFRSRVGRPGAHPDVPDGFRSFSVVGLGSTGVEVEHLDDKQNTFGVITFDSEIIVEVKAVHPDKPSGQTLWSVTVPTSLR